MKIRFWGARGSIPVCGKQFLKYGGSTTCVEIIDKDENSIIVDSGTGIRNLGKELVKNEVKKITMVFTHQHWDHVMGFPFFAPIYRNVEIEVMGCSYSTDDTREIIAKTMQPPGFPVKFEEIEAKFKFKLMCKDGCKINENLDIFPIELSHPNGGLGYKFVESGKEFVFLTDNELGYLHYGGRSFEDYVRFCSGAELLVHDADYTDEEYVNRKTWGHSTWSQALELAIKSGVNYFGLFHHNQDRTDKEIDAIVAQCNKILKQKKLKIKCFAVREGQEIIL